MDMYSLPCQAVLLPREGPARGLSTLLHKENTHEKNAEGLIAVLAVGLWSDPGQAPLLLDPGIGAWRQRRWSGPARYGICIAG